MEDKPARTSLIMAALVLSVIAIVVALVAAAEVENKVKKQKMTVYGGSFIDLPHAPLNSPSLDRADVGTPAPEIHPTQVAGVSFSHLFSEDDQ